MKCQCILIAHACLGLALERGESTFAPHTLTRRECACLCVYCRVCSALEEPFGKPHPAVYLTCAQRLNVDPTRCIAIEDSVTGCLAAKAARMRLIAVPEAPPGKRSKSFGIADVVLSSLVDFDAGVLARAFE